MKKELTLTINDKKVTATLGQTILDVAKECGIDVPTLCHDDRVKTSGACGQCVVEIKGSPKLVRACSTLASEGQVILTNSNKVIENRKVALELLLSDHSGDCKAPCHSACPAGTDCQGYVGLIANGYFKEAYDLIRENIIFPSSIGRVCPRPCEDKCIRKLIEEPIAICELKKFVGDEFLNKDHSLSPITNHLLSNKTIGVVGGGPAGLTVAYFLKKKGYNVTIYESEAKMGGMLMYGIPKYRLEKPTLQKEIDLVRAIGVEFKNNITIGKDISFQDLRKKHNAIVVAIGAWSSTLFGCKGEDLNGVVGGINFLYDVIDGKINKLKGNIAVVGGGNSAMDAARSAIRLGATNVYSIYRRTENEMPANPVEIKEAKEEGVIFKTLANPTEIIEKNGKVSAIKLQHMELGKEDSSGRKSPVPVKDKIETLNVDLVIMAIGQKPSLKGFEDILKTNKATILACENTFLTNLDGVFAIGDATNKGADIAVSAIGEALKAAKVIDRYLSGKELGEPKIYLSKTEKAKEDFKDEPNKPRTIINHRCKNERKNDFNEFSISLTKEQAMQEANRCKECGCLDFYNCKLIDYANKLLVEPIKFAGKKNTDVKNDSHKHISRDPKKCVLCGLCVRFCEEVSGVGALGYVNRGFNAVVKPAFDMNLEDVGCVSCGGCVSVCPTGALVEKYNFKPVPLKEQTTSSNCKTCSINCKQEIKHVGSFVTKILPAGNNGLLCEKGRFDIDALSTETKVLKNTKSISIDELKNAKEIILISSPLISKSVAGFAINIAKTNGALVSEVKNAKEAICAIQNFVSPIIVCEDKSLTKKLEEEIEVKNIFSLVVLYSHKS